MRTEQKTAVKNSIGRLVFVALSVLLQVIWICVQAMKLNRYSTWISVATSVLTLVVVILLYGRRTNAAFKMPWIILILAFPVLGLGMYLLFGRKEATQLVRERFERIDQSLDGLLIQDKAVRIKLQQTDRMAANEAEYIWNYAKYPIYQNTDVVFYKEASEGIEAQKQALNQAKHFIFIEYFIINDGVMWQTILNILEKKAKEGVDVRLIYDGFGCLTTLPYKYDQEMRRRGIKCEVFNRFRPILNIIQNNRDHRKICVIDGWTGFTGGINLADEYINQRKRFGHWKDTAVMLKGEGVWNMTAMFLYMWGIVTRTDTSLDFGNYVPHRWHPNEFPGNGYVQPFCDSPLDDEIVGENVYLNIINRAKNYVYICTPYLIIDNEMMTALCLAAKSGVDVRIMTPGIPDKKMVFLLTQSYYKQLLEAGVKIYEYQPGFLHAKSFVCDDKVGVVGTINLDYRSLYLHFEDGVWMYKNDVILDIRDDFTETLEYCDPIDLAFCQKRNIVVRAIQNVLRVFAPLL